MIRIHILFWLTCLLIVSGCNMPETEAGVETIISIEERKDFAKTGNIKDANVDYYLNITYNRLYVQEIDIPVIRQQYFSEFLGLLSLSMLQSSDPYKERWVVHPPGRPEGDADLGETLEEDPRVEGSEHGG